MRRRAVVILCIAPWLLLAAAASNGTPPPAPAAETASPAPAAPPGAQVVRPVYVMLHWSGAEFDRPGSAVALMHTSREILRDRLGDPERIRLSDDRIRKEHTCGEGPCDVVTVVRTNQREYSLTIECADPKHDPYMKQVDCNCDFTNDKEREILCNKIANRIMAHESFAHKN